MQISTPIFFSFLAGSSYCILDSTTSVWRHADAVQFGNAEGDLRGRRSHRASPLPIRPERQAVDQALLNARLRNGTKLRSSTIAITPESMLRNNETIVSIDTLVSLLAYVISPRWRTTVPAHFRRTWLASAQRLFKLPRQIIIRRLEPPSVIRLESSAD